MLVIDTNHLDVLLFGGEPARRLAARLHSSGHEIATTIINVEEKARGWLNSIHKNNTTVKKQVRDYADFQQILTVFCHWQVLSFQDVDADLFMSHRRNGITPTKIAPMDLKIACIAFNRGAIILTADVDDFGIVPGVTTENWIA